MLYAKCAKHREKQPTVTPHFLCDVCLLILLVRYADSYLDDPWQSRGHASIAPS